MEHRRIAKKMRKRPPPRTLEVRRKDLITPHMLRVTLGGPGLNGFPDDSDGGYIKLRLAEPDGVAGKPLVRTYTVRHYDVEACEIDVDFVIHDSDGPAANWAQSCEPGDKIKVGGPGPKKLLDSSADWFLLVGDMSALPAISANIERMEPDAKGYALLEIIDEDDKQELDFPQNLQVEWIVNSNPEQENSVLLDRVKALHWLPGRPYVWVAGEFSQSLAIRSLLKSERNVTREQMYASSYWQIGQTEDGHKISKQEAADA
jgi:NADPH-dependent ferric siderophore reductase